MDPKAGMDVVEKKTFLTLRELELIPLGRPGHSQSLYAIPALQPSVNQNNIQKDHSSISFGLPRNTPVKRQ
jgi:hypothetical protein